MKRILSIVMALSILSASVLFTASCEKKTTANDTSGTLGMQLEKPEKGEEIAIMTTSMGEIKIRFFPAQAPKAVENFKGHAKSGYYKDVTFHRVIKDFMIQGGDPKGDGTGGESIYKSAFEDEFSKNLVNIRGSLSMANSGPNTNGSQFFINQATKEKFSWTYLENQFNAYRQNPSQYGDGSGLVDFNKATKEYKEFYTENGGNPNLDGAYSVSGKGHTVFAQVFEGMEIVDEIANVKVNSSDKPETPVTIQKIEIVKY